MVSSSTGSESAPYLIRANGYTPSLTVTLRRLLHHLTAILTVAKLSRLFPAVRSYLQTSCPGPPSCSRERLAR